MSLYYSISNSSVPYFGRTIICSRFLCHSRGFRTGEVGWSENNFDRLLAERSKRLGHKVTITGNFKAESYEKEKGEREEHEKKEAAEAGDIRVTNTPCFRAPHSSWYSAEQPLREALTREKTYTEASRKPPLPLLQPTEAPKRRGLASTILQPLIQQPRTDFGRDW